MFTHVLRRMRQRIRTGDYVMSLHAEEEMVDDDLSIFDVERCVLVGTISERQTDHKTGEWKYVIQGPAIGGAPVTVVAKLSPTGKLVIVTVYRD